MVAVEALNHTAGGAAASVTASRSARVVSTRERRISSRLRSVYRQFTDLPARFTSTSDPSIVWAIRAGSAHVTSPVRPTVLTSYPSALNARTTAAPTNPLAPATTALGRPDI